MNLPQDKNQSPQRVSKNISADTEDNLRKEIEELIGERNFARRSKSWGIARDLTKEIRRLKCQKII